MFVIVLGTLQLLDVDLRTLLLGGAITGVVVGIAAQQPLSNFFAGLVLLFARPYVPGPVRPDPVGRARRSVRGHDHLRRPDVHDHRHRRGPGQPAQRRPAGERHRAGPEPPLEPDPDSQL